MTAIWIQIKYLITGSIFREKRSLSARIFTRSSGSITRSSQGMSKADEAESVDEVMDLIAEMQIDYATRMRAINQKNVVNLHVRRAIDYIYNNLNKSLFFIIPKLSTI